MTATVVSLAGTNLKETVMKTVAATLLIYDDFTTERIEGDAREPSAATIDVSGAYPPLPLEGLAADVQDVYREHWPEIDETLGLSARRRRLADAALADAHEDFPSAAGADLDALGLARLKNEIFGRIASRIRIREIATGTGGKENIISCTGPEAVILRLMRREGWLDEVAAKYST